MSSQEPARNKKVAVALVGFGNRGLEHVEALELASSGVEIRCVCDFDTAALKRARKRLPDAKAGVDLADLLRESPCELVVFCLPPGIDLRPINEVIAADPVVKAVLVEKPAANSASIAKEAFRDLSVPVFLFHQMRFLPWAKRAKDWFQEKSTSSVKPVTIEAFCYGKFTDQGLHVFDLACWIAGGLPGEVCSVLAEADPARISAGEPLPFDWRLDHSHAGPTVLEVEARWEKDRILSLKTGPSAADGWLGKGIRISFEEGDWLEFGPTGLSEGDSSGVTSVIEGVLEDYKIATASVYEAISIWLAKGGGTPDLPGFADHLEQLGWYEGLLEHETIERLPPPYWLESERPNLPILVVIPLSDHRGVAQKCIRSWACDQDCNAEDYELVVISNQDTADIGSSIRPFLRPSDRLIETDMPTAALGQGDMEEYVIGIESRNSEWIFLTEPHCEAYPDTITEIKRFFSTNEAAGFCTDCEDFVKTPWGALEARYSAEGFAEFQREGHWGKMIMRGFGIRRTAYELAGGFRLRYGRFSEWLLGADLHRRGLYLAFADKVSLLHYYTLDQEYLSEAIEEFVIGQARYSREAPESERLPYFQNPLVVDHVPPSLKLLLKTALQLQGLPSFDEIEWISAKRLKVIKREWNALMVHFFASWNPAKAFPFFKAYYEAQIQASLLKEAESYPAEISAGIEPGQEWTAAAGELGGIVEIHQREVWKEQPFHWAKPTFAIPVNLSSLTEGELILKLVLPDILRELNGEKVCLISSWDAKYPVSPVIERNGGEVTLSFRIAIKTDAARSHPLEGYWLAINSPSLKAGLQETRKLGLPLSKVGLRFDRC